MVSGTRCLTPCVLTFFRLMAAGFSGILTRMESTQVDQLAKIIWDYHHLNHRLEQADVMLVLGGHDLRVPEYAADLFVRGLVPYVVISGGVAHTDDLLKTDWSETEAEKFAEVMMRCGVPKEKISLENQAKNTGDNFSLSRRLIEGQVGRFQSVLVVTKPYMERRAFATGQKQWPDIKLVVTSPQISFDQYTQGAISKDDIINIMMGDLQRIDVYGRKGFQIPQEIPDRVRRAFEELKNLGYTKHLLHNE